jgi:two-component system CheB/CheR fusion protein
MNIYAMARQGLQSELPGAIRKAKLSKEPVKLHKLNVGTNGGTQMVDVTLQLIEKPDPIKGTIMIVFADVANASLPSKRKSKAGNQKSSIREQELEKELQQANEELKSTREDMQTTQEELKSTNEEMQSTNEELQSTNEELTTSKEEMQSLNEELQTVNNELQSKIADYVAANNDMKNLLNSTDIATLFLDKDLNIRRFTEQTTRLFKLRQADIGRPFTEIVNKLNYPRITDHAHEVLRTLVFKESEITTSDQQWFTIRIMPYRTVDDRIDGLVITFVDNTQQKMVLNDLDELKSNFENTLHNSNIMLAICDTELRYKWIFNQQPGFDINMVIGKRDDQIDKNKGTTALMKLKKQVLDTGKPADEIILFSVEEKTVSYHVLAQPIKDKQGNITGISICASECEGEKLHTNKTGG